MMTEQNLRNELEYNTHKLDESLGDLKHICGRTAELKGFHEGYKTGNITDAMAKVALIMTELGELVEAMRENKGHQAEAEELADVLIRCFDFAYLEGYNINQAVLKKMATNISRPHMHGKKA